MIADESTHRALAYVAAATRSGNGLDVGALEAFMRAPDKRKPLYESTLTKSLLGSVASLQDAFGMTGRQISPGESWAEYFERLRWASVERGTLRLTDLGRNILRELDNPTVDLDSDDPVTVIIDPNDQFAYVRVFERISSQGAGMLIDPYLDTAQLLNVLQIPSVNRILTGSRKVSEHPLMAMALGSISDPPELRWMPQEHVHDRYFIPDSGDLLVFGTSLNSIAKRPGIIIPVKDPAAVGATRKEYGRLWRKATTLAPVVGDGGATQEE